MAACTTAAGILSTDAAPSLDCSTAGMVVHPDGCLTDGYPICLGAITDVKEVITSALGAHDEDPSDGHFADDGHAFLGVRLPAGVEHVPECPYH